MFMRLTGRLRSDERGFTLIELLIVVIILGVLAGVVVFAVGGLSDQGQEVAYETDARTLQRAQEAFYAKYGRYGTMEELVAEGFLREASTYNTVDVADDGQSYKVVCIGAACERVDGIPRGGTLVVAIGSPSGILNPAATTQGGVHTNSEPMFNGLVGWGRDGKPTPELASSWQISNEGRTATFKLRRNVQWHDGKPFTSADVKFTFERVLLGYHSRTAASVGPALGVTGSGAATNVPAGKITAPDAYTVVFNFDYPYAPLLRQLNVTEAPIIPKHVYEACADAGTIALATCAPNNAPVGTGPFKFASRSATEIVLDRNPRYFRSGQPYLDKLVMVNTSNPEVALEAGAVDYIWSVRGQYRAQLAANPDIRMTPSSRGTGGGNCVSTLAYNLKARGDRNGQAGGPNPGGTASPHAILKDKRVRHAIAHAINRAAGFANIQSGEGSVATAPIHSGIADAYAGGLALPGYDVAEANRLLDEAGWVRPIEGGTRTAQWVPGVANGTPLKLDFHHFTPATGVQAQWGQQIKADLAEVGIDLETVGSGTGDFQTKVFTERQFDTAIISYCNGDDPQIGVRRQYHSSQVSIAGFSNASGYKSAQMDGLWQEAAQAVDVATYRQKYRQIQELALEDFPYFWLVESVSTRANRAKCAGFNHENTGLFAEGAYCAR